MYDSICIKSTKCELIYSGKQISCCHYRDRHGNEGTGMERGGRKRLQKVMRKYGGVLHAFIILIVDIVSKV